MRSSLQVNDAHTCILKLDSSAEANILLFDLRKQVCSLVSIPISIVICGFGNTINKPIGSVDVAGCDRMVRDFSLFFMSRMLLTCSFLVNVHETF